jgi:FAD-linked sulfhydryl oxidase
MASAHGASIKEPAGSKVNVLNKDLFPRFIARNPLVLMEWYTPWCEHCQTMAPVYTEAAAKLIEMKKNDEIPIAVKLAKMDDGDEYNRQGRWGAPDNYNFTGYPTFIIFKDGKKHDWYYGGRHYVEDFTEYMAAVSRGQDPIEIEKILRPGLYRNKTDELYDLAPENFNATVKRPASMDNNIIWLVEFYSDRCPMCKAFSPEIIGAAGEIKHKYKDERFTLAAMNSRVYYEVAEQNDVKSYPVVIAFYDGKKLGDMPGYPNADTITAYGKQMADEHFDPSKGKRPALGPAVYDSDRLLVMPPEVAAYAKEDAAKWLAIENEKRAAEGLPPLEVKETAKLTEALAGITGIAPAAGAPAAAPATAAPAAAAPVVAAKALPVAPAPVVEVAVNADGSALTAEQKSAAWRAKLGSMTWFFLHTMAAKYPELPSEVDQRTMRNFVAGLGQHYPCKLCRKHLKLKLMDPALGPVRVNNRTALATWFCELHNMVNVDTGKPNVHDCSIVNLDLQYLKDCGECDAGAKKVEGQSFDDGKKVFDARLYAKDESQLLSEMSEAMELLATRVGALQEENALLREKLGGNVALDFGDI